MPSASSFFFEMLFKIRVFVSGIYFANPSSKEILSLFSSVTCVSPNHSGYFPSSSGSSAEAVATHTPIPISNAKSIVISREISLFMPFFLRYFLQHSAR